MKSTHGNVPFKHNVVRLTWGNNGICAMITSMKSTHRSVPLSHSAVRPKKTHVSTRARGFFFFFFFFILVRFINRGKRSEMVSVVSRYERNEI